MNPPATFVAETYWFSKPVRLMWNTRALLRLQPGNFSAHVVIAQTGSVSCVARD